MTGKQSTFKLEEFLPFRLLNVSEGMSLQFAEGYRRKYSMTRPEWRAFAIIGEHGEITATDVGHISHMHKTKVSRAIASLADRGWLRRERDERDGRIEHLQLSSRGKTHYKKMTQEATLFNTNIEARLGSEGMATVWRAIEALDKLQM